MGHCQQVRRSGPSTLLSTGETTPRVFCQLLIFPVQEKLVATKVHPTKGHNDLGAQESLLCRKADRTGNVQPGNEQRGFRMVSLIYANI